MPGERHVGIRLHGTADQAETALLRAQLERAPYPPLALEHEVEPTEQEARIIDGTLRAAGDVCKAVNVEPILVTPNRVHVVAEAEFREKVSEWSEGKTRLGHVFLMPSRNNLVDFARIMSHEVAHAISHYELEATVLPEEKRMKLHQRRLGAVFQPRTLPEMNVKTFFNGFNEGVTELFALQIRKLLADELPWENEGQKAELTTRVDYHPHVLLVDELIRQVAAAEKIQRRDVRQLLFQDYLQGTFEFLRHLNRVDRRAVKLLAGMNHEPAEALRVARALQLSECAEKIEALAESDKSAVD